VTARGVGDLTAIEQRAVDILARGPTTCARLGDALWGRRRSGNCSCPWVKQGVVRRAPDKHATLYELVRRPR